ncbi:MAG: hypothetical protein AB1716_26865 [Planctomycetota bacterium]
MSRAWIAVAALALAAGCSAPAPKARKPSPAGPPPPEMSAEAVVCPADVQACPDGSFVSRDPDNGCVFRRCPGAPNPK